MNETALAYQMVAGIGHNQPPLAEQLTEETEALRQRTEDLVAAASRAAVTDDDTAGKATLLAKMIKDHAGLIETTREDRKKPFLDAGRLVDLHFGNLRAPLIGTDAKKIGGACGTVIGMVDAYRRKKEAEAIAERARLEEEARQAREKVAAAERARQAAEAELLRQQQEAERKRQEAEAAARRQQEEADRKIREAEETARRAGDQAAAAEAARARAVADAARQAADAEAARARAEADANRRREEAAATQRRLDAEIAERQERERATELDRQAAATRATPIDSGNGAKATGRKVVVVTIDDLSKAARHCVKVAEPEVRELVQKIYERMARAKIRDLPGATVTEDSATTIR